MSEKKRMSTWVPTIVMGVVAILFSVYALQEQTELQQANKEIERMKSDLVSCEQRIAVAANETARYKEEARIATESARLARAETVELRLKSTKRK